MLDVNNIVSVIKCNSIDMLIHKLKYIFFSFLFKIYRKTFFKITGMDGTVSYVIILSLKIMISHCIQKNDFDQNLMIDL